MSWSERLDELGIALPEVVAPLAAYVPAVRTGNLVYTAGQLPISGGELVETGKVGAEVSVDDAKHLARRCALNALAAVDGLVGIDAVVRVVKVVGFVASAPGFGGQPVVINGASELFGRSSATQVHTPDPPSGCRSFRAIRRWKWRSSSRSPGRQRSTEWSTPRTDC